MRIAMRLVGWMLLGLWVGEAAGATERLPKKELEKLATDWMKKRPATYFEAWDGATRQDLVERARGLGEIPTAKFDEALEIVWKALRKARRKVRGEIDTPYGEATWIQKGKGGKKSGLLLGLHGGGEGAGSASEAASNWNAKRHLAMYPQGIRLVHDTWNTVHGEKFLLTLIEIAKLQYDIDPDRVYSVGFSMGGTGSWFMAGRHPDLLAGAIPAHGVIMASPAAQLATKEEVTMIQHGMLPNVRNLAVYYYTGLVDMNCKPGTYLYAWDRLQELREKDGEGGYELLQFQAHERLAHSFPKGEPKAGLKWVQSQARMTFPETVVWEYADQPFPLKGQHDLTDRYVKNWFYWLHCSKPVDQLSVRAKRDGNVFALDVKVGKVEDFSIGLHPSMIDWNEDVVVQVGDQEVYRGRPVMNYESLFESLDARMDKRMVFGAMVPLGTGE